MPDPNGADPQPNTPGANTPEDPVKTTPTEPNTDSLPTDVGACHAMIKDLRREAGNYRTKNVELQNEKIALENKIATANGNSAELLTAKNEEIARLKQQVEERDTKLSGYASQDEAAKEAVLATIPESIRSKYASLPLETLRTLAEDLPKPTGSDVRQPAGGSGDTTPTLDEAVAGGDQKKIAAAFNAELAKVGKK
jgi:hypothetical protein